MRECDMSQAGSNHIKNNKRKSGEKRMNPKKTEKKTPFSQPHIRTAQIQQGGRGNQRKPRPKNRKQKKTTHSKLSHYQNVHNHHDQTHQPLLHLPLYRTQLSPPHHMPPSLFRLLLSLLVAVMIRTWIRCRCCCVCLRRLRLSYGVLH